MQLVKYIGIAASACTAISLFPQLLKTIREKKASDISYWVLAILIAGLTLWIIYGTMINDLIIIISNAISLSINITLLLLNLKYKRKQE